MKHLLKFIAFILATIVVISTIVAFTLQYYLRQPEMIENIRITASRIMGARVDFNRLEVHLLRGLDADNVTVSTSPDGGDNFLDVGTIQFRYVPWKLLLGDLDFSTITCRRPVVNFQQDANQEWKLPNPDNGEEPITFDSGWLSFNILLRQFLLDEGSVRVATHEEAEIFKADGIRIDGQFQRVPSGITAGGDVSVASFDFYQILQFTDLQSSISFENDKLIISGLKATSYGSEASGSGELDLGRDGPSFQATLNFNRIHIQPFLADLRGPSELARGKLNLQCTVKGNLNHPELLQGTGTFELIDVSLSGSTFIQSISDVLTLPDLVEETYPQIKAEFKIAEREFTLYRLEGGSDHLRFSVSGTVNADRMLDLDVLLVLEPEWAARLPSPVLSRFPPDREGRVSLTFKVTGPLDDPHTNLQERLNLPQPAPETE